MRKFFLLALMFVSGTLSAAELPSRIVSVGGAVTEIIYVLEEQQRLVGSDTTSYYPPAAAKLPKVGYQRNLSAEGILSLNPDLLLLTEDAGPSPVLTQIKSAGVEIVILKSAKSVAHVRQNILSIGDVLGKTDQALNLVKELDQTLDKVSVKVSKQKHKPSVLFLTSHGTSTPMVAGLGTSASSLIDLAGGRNVADGFSGYKPLTPEAAVKYAPDIILITSRSLKMNGGKTGLLKIPGVGLTPAGQAGNIIHMDGLLLMGFGPRTGDAALELHKKIQASL
ncbi:MAG: ABC transporter substrate-binding protein [Sneathiella sp.]|nr:ABC transporter substrate-binding protein [Sneathiella sp.]